MGDITMVKKQIQGKKYRYIGGSELEKRYPDLKPNNFYHAIGVDSFNLIITVGDETIPIGLKFFDIPQLKGTAGHTL